MTQTYNPSDKGSGVTLSNGNLSVAFGTNYEGVRALTGKSSGKWYWETTIGPNAYAAGSVDGPGLAKGTVSLATWPGHEANAWQYLILGDVYSANAVAFSAGTTFTNGDVIGCAFDADNGKLYFHKNGAYLNSGNPAAGTGAVVTGLTSGPYYPIYGGGNGGGVNCTSNFGNTFAYSVPSGFSGFNQQTLTLACAVGAFSLVGKAINLIRTKPIVCAAGAYAVAGQAAAFHLARKVIAVAGSYALAGVAATLNRGKTIIALAGAYTYAGVAAGTKAARKVVAAVGTYTYTGVAAAVKKALRMTMTAGAYVLSGKAVLFSAARKISIGAGAYTIAGVALIVAHATFGPEKFKRRLSMFKLQNLRSSLFKLED